MNSLCLPVREVGGSRIKCIAEETVAPDYKVTRALWILVT